MDLLTSSRMKSYRACPRQHLYAHVRGYQPVRESEFLRFGTTIHDCTGAWWIASSSESRDLAFNAALAQLPPTMDPVQRARAQAMLMGYDAFWRDAPFEAVAVEKEFRLPLLNPETEKGRSRTWMLAGKVDAILRVTRTGEWSGHWFTVGDIWIRELKTTSEDASPGSPYRQRLTLDGQISQYVEGARALGYEPRGVLYDVMVKPKHDVLLATPVDQRKYTKPTKAEPVPRLYANQRERDETIEEFRTRVVEAIMEAPHRFYQAVPIVRLEDERDEWRWDVWQLARLMRESANTGHAPRNPDACFKYGAACAFWPVCSGEASLDDVTRYTHVGATPELETTNSDDEGRAA
jgi:hypothetical protein